MKKEIRKELDSLAPKLARQKKKNIYNVPDHYFESLFDDLSRRIKSHGNETNDEPKQETRIKRSLDILKSPITWSIAASLVLLISVFQFTDLSLEQNIIDLSDQEILAYLDENLDDFDSNIFYEYGLIDENDMLEINIEFTESENQYFENIIQDMDDETLEEVFF